MPEVELVLFVGLQASGKTSFYRARFSQTHVHVSKDRLRNNRRPERRQRQLIREAVGAGRSVVVDNTNPTRADRTPLIAIGREFGARIIGYYFTSSVRKCLDRNRTRTGRELVPEVAIYTTAGRLEPPDVSEGFDALYCVRLQEGGGFEVQEGGDGQMAARERIIRTAATVWRGLPAVLLAWVVAALLIRLTVRDRLLVLSVLFYMTPLIVSAMLAGTAALIWLRRHCWRLSGLAGGLALLSAIWFHVSACAHHSVEP
jgi:predicted kinase